MTLTTAPLTKSLELRCSVEHAFRVFTDEIASWWPLETHQLSDGGATSCTFEPREGGHIYESTDDGDECDWGEVLACEVPSRIVFTWQVTSEPTEVEVRFTSLPDGRTRVELEHRSWENLGPRADEVRTNYDRGWVGVLECYEAAIAESR